MNKIYFPNLNGLRFVAAFLVIIHHVEQLKYLIGLDSYWSNPVVKLIGKLGVVLFFVLSGFLITYLLLEEEKETKTIDVKKFYFRRVLRIWPLYFLIVLLGFFVISNIPFFNLNGLSDSVFLNFGEKFLMFVFFIPNIALVIYPAVPFVAQTWSVGVEEQFYVIWPIAIKFVKQKHLFFYVIILGYLIMNIFGFKFIKTHLYNDGIVDKMAAIWSVFNIDCMAIGGLFAFYLHKNSTIIKYLYSGTVQWIVILALCFFIGFGVTVPYIHYEFYSVLFGILILNLASNVKTAITLESPLLNYLGKISYGLYMYHAIGIIIALKLLVMFDVYSPIVQYLLSILISILLASISYKYFEVYFIKMKLKYSKILSGDNTSF